ncbi:glycosyltransferase family 2 protein [Uliginosibacterium sp. H3]|uniref:Glycosyltransferase family 2 protein n=1 Tax=Uliginosibacterium silvisoli TaxID=3114758 RepID=A0ABU6K834_9RHOO|nr:glycosyltransferase family 2 protein [Uliginosibacterium sp. H3]
MPTFSIILATRDRPVLFSEALESVLTQSFTDFEIHVVNDGSAPEHLAAYESVIAAAQARIGDRIKSHWLVRRPKGHGQSYSLNYGVDQASGEYIGILDDDDTWTDNEHLARAAKALASRPADMYMANQRAFLLNKELQGPIWLSELAREVAARGSNADADGVFSVSIDDLMATSGFCHLNCLIVRRSLYQGVGMMDEGIRWECDRDIFLRLIDQAGTMLHHPAVVSRHNVPDPSKTLNMTTAMGMLDKRLLQVRVLDKAALFSKHAAIRKHGRMHKGYALKKVVEELAGKQQWQTAASYAWQALGALPTLKWAAYSTLCQLRSWLQGNKA